MNLVKRRIVINAVWVAGIVGVRYISRDEARSGLFGYIDIYYNGQRLHPSLSYLRPLAYENQYDRLPHVAQLFVH